MLFYERAIAEHGIGGQGMRLFGEPNNTARLKLLTDEIRVPVAGAILSDMTAG